MVEDLAAAVLLHLRSEIARTLHALRPCHVDDLGAEGLHRCGAFGAGVLRHDQHHAIAAHRRDHRKGNARVAARGLDQRVAGRDLAALLGVAKHAQRRPVLHRAGRVVALQLGKNAIAAVAQVRIEALNPDQRRVADRGV